MPDRGVTALRRYFYAFLRGSAVTRAGRKRGLYKYFALRRPNRCRTSFGRLGPSEGSGHLVAVDEEGDLVLGCDLIGLRRIPTTPPLSQGMGRLGGWKNFPIVFRADDARGPESGGRRTP